MDVAALPIDDPLWGAFVASHPAATPFHLPDWAGLIADCYGFKASALVARDSGGEILAGAPTIAVRSPLGRLRWVCLPFSDVCPPLAGPGADADAAITALGEFALARGAKEFEVRADLPAADDTHAVEVGYQHTLALPKDPADLHPNKGHRNSRNQAIRKGVQVAHGTAEADVATFYRLHTLTRRRHGVPVQPRRLFNLIWERLLSKGFGFVATASLDGEPMASAIYLGYNGTLVAKYHASDPTRPNTGAGYLIDWETMVTGCTEGYHTLDMGRSDFGADGLRLYKSSWGAEERPLVYTHVSHRPPGRGRPSVGELPKRIIRHSPLWVCRGLGELLYRWAG